jgi:two-component system, response regulator PdtaR
VFNADYKLIQRMAPAMQRVLVVDPAPAGAKLLSELLRNICPCQIFQASTTAKAIELIRSADPQIIFIEFNTPEVDGVAFTKHLRRSEARCRQAPVIVTAATATAAGIMGARDAGVHEFLRKPFTVKDLMRRLEAVTLRQRDWIEAVHYIGPDRRRFNSGDYSGPLKRRSDARETPDAARIAQALKILRSAVGAVESDPAQALRAMLAQASDIQKAAVGMANMRLVQAAAEFQRYLLTQSATSGMKSAVVEAHAAALLSYIPPEGAAQGDDRDVA